MIILIDNKNFMIRYCEDDPNIHGFDTSFPNWKGLVTFLSDIGERVVVSGPEAEKFLDDNNIYYVHVEHVAKESFAKFVRRLDRLVEANKEYIETSLSFGKLIFAVTKEGKKGTVSTDNLMSVWRYNEDGRYYFNPNMDRSLLQHKRVDQALTVEKAVADFLGIEDMEELQDLSDEVDELLYAECSSEKEAFSSDNIHDVMVKVLGYCEVLAKQYETLCYLGYSQKQISYLKLNLQRGKETL